MKVVAYMKLSKFQSNENRIGNINLWDETCFQSSEWTKLPSSNPYKMWERGDKIVSVNENLQIIFGRKAESGRVDLQVEGFERALEMVGRFSMLGFQIRIIRTVKYEPYDVVFILLEDDAFNKIVLKW